MSIGVRSSKFPILHRVNAENKGLEILDLLIPSAEEEIAGCFTLCSCCHVTPSVVSFSGCHGLVNSVCLWHFLIIPT